MTTEDLVVPESPSLPWLAQCLRHRLAVIADHAWRDRDPEGHLQALKDVSMALIRCHQQWTAQLDRRLDHFLENCSYDKALSLLESTDPVRCGTARGASSTH